MKTNLRTASICVHGGYEAKNGEPIEPPIVQSTTFKYDNSEEMAMLFDLKKEGYFYSRLQNPTNDVVAQKIAQLEGGVGAVLTSSGQAANFYAVFNICEAGDHIVTSNEIYGGTFNLFGVTLKKLGIDCTFVNPNDSEEEIQKAFRPTPRLSSARPSVILDVRYSTSRSLHALPIRMECHLSSTTPLPHLSTAVPSNGVPTS